MQATDHEPTLEELYQELKRHMPAVQDDHRLRGPGVQSITVRSPVCGSEVTLDARIVDDRVEQLGWRVRACALGQSTTAIVIDHAKELDAQTVHRVSQQLQATLKGEGYGCDWAELDVFAGAHEITSRHESAMLPFRALEQLFARARKEAH